MPGSRQNDVTRRAILGGCAAALTLPVSRAWPAAAEGRSLGQRAATKGLAFGASFSTEELNKPYADRYAAIYAEDCRVLTSELEFKMYALRPSADTLDFGPADKLLAVATAHQQAVRGHTLIWNDAQPDWVKRLGPGEVEHLLETHIETVMERYRGRVASWDVVNEPIGPWDHQPGNLRTGPYYATFGEAYIAKSFEIARRIDPKAELVLNEAQTESNDENGATFRASLLALLKRLKDRGAPIDTIGLQSHIDTARPYDFARFADFVREIIALGYGVAITELDVNDRALDGAPKVRDPEIAKIYRDYLAAVLPITEIKTLTLWQLADHTSWLWYDAVAKGTTGTRLPRPLLYDQAFNKKPAWYAIADAFEAMPARKL